MFAAIILPKKKKKQHKITSLKWRFIQCNRIYCNSIGVKFILSITSETGQLSY